MLICYTLHTVGGNAFVELKERADIIDVLQNLVSCLQGYVGHDSSTPDVKAVLSELQVFFFIGYQRY